MNRNAEVLWRNAYMEEKAKSDRLEVLYRTAGKWIELFSRGVSLKNILGKWGIQRFVIYGASEFAVRMLECCEKEKIAVAAITDQRITVMGGIYNGIPLIPVQKVQDYVGSSGCIIVTTVVYFEEIKCELRNMGCIKILSLEQLLNGTERTLGEID